ncbi:hypothetical protein MFAL_38380 [Mycolicibacterium fallax]|nr:hypothetical protein MFAL_38380 [Mycolicibacterium fallax]
MAAGVAAAGAGAVALTALTPATQPELAAAPVASHQIVLTAGDFDLADNLETLWNGANGRATMAGVALATYAASIGPGLEVGLKNEPLTTLAAMPLMLTAALQHSDIFGSGGLVPNPSNLSNDYYSPGAWAPAVKTVADNIDDAGAKVIAQQIRGNQNLTSALKTEALRGSLGAAERVRSVTRALEDNDLKGALTKAFKDNPKDLRKQLVGADASGALGGSLGAIRNTVDTNRTNLRTAVDTQLNKSDAGKSVQKNVVKPVRKAVDKVRDTVRETGDKVRKEVRKALDN